MTDSIRLAWDGGVTDGNPGEGRVRVNSAKIERATHMLVNAQDRHEALLAELLPSFAMGDVLALTRDGAGGQIIAWVIGEIVHGGDYYKIPIKVRSVDGAFAAHDLVTLHRLEEASLLTPPVLEQQPAPVLAAPEITLPAADPPPPVPADMTEAILLLTEALQKEQRRNFELEQRVTNLELVLGEIGVGAAAIAARGEAHGAA